VLSAAVPAVEPLRFFVAIVELLVIVLITALDLVTMLKGALQDQGASTGAKAHS
jgi:hypothetical protein